MLVEAHWADVVPDAKFAAVAKWLLVVAPFTIIGLVRDLPRRYREHRSLGTLSAVFWIVPAFVGRVIVGAILFPLWFAPLVALIGLAALIPGHVGAVVLGRIQGFISSALGDSFRFVADPVMRQQVLTRVSHDLEWAARRSPRVICIGHSQGGHIAVTTLASEIELGTNQWKLWTWGSGYRKLVELERVVKEGPAAATRGMFAVLVLPLSALLGFLSGGWPVLLGVGVAALAVLGWWLFRIAPSVRVSALDVGAQLPPELAWTDLWATHDVVPDGALPGSRARSDAVVNRRSPIWDHSSYASNVEEVILPLVRSLGPAFDVDNRPAARLSEVRRLWWWAYRTLTVVAFGSGLISVFRHGFGKAALPLITIMTLVVWSRLELGWRLRYRRRVAHGSTSASESAWLASSVEPRDFPVLAGLAGIGTVIASAIGGRDVSIAELNPLTIPERGFELSPAIGTVGVLAAVAATYVLMRPRASNSIG